MWCERGAQSSGKHNENGSADENAQTLRGIKHVKILLETRQMHYVHKLTKNDVASPPKTNPLLTDRCQGTANNLRSRPFIHGMLQH